MARVLLAWELGDGLGHVGRLLPLAQRLRQDGHECLFAVRNLIEPYKVIAGADFPMMQAPYIHPYAPKSVEQKPIGTLGDVMATIGFSDLRRLAPIVVAWKSLLDQLRPDLIVADYSPILGLVAHGAYPYVILGDGFTMPPAHLATFPPLFEGTVPRVEEPEMVRIANEAAALVGGKQIAALPEIFAADANFVVTLPELDPHRDHRPTAQVGPLDALPPPSQTVPDMDFFAYLSMTFGATEKVLEALVQAKLRGEIFLRDAGPDTRRKWADRGLTIHDRPQDLKAVLPRARMLIHHGGLGTTEVGLAIGCPQLMVPRHREQMTNFRSASKLGVCVGMRSGGNFEPSHVLQAVKALATESKFLDKARAHAQDIARRGPWNGLDRITESCLGLLKQRA